MRDLYVNNSQQGGMVITRILDLRVCMCTRERPGNCFTISGLLSVSITHLRIHSGGNVFLFRCCDGS